MGASDATSTQDSPGHGITLDVFLLRDFLSSFVFHFFDDRPDGLENDSCETCAKNARVLGVHEVDVEVRVDE